MLKSGSDMAAEKVKERKRGGGSVSLLQIMTHFHKDKHYRHVGIILHMARVSGEDITPPFPRRPLSPRTVPDGHPQHYKMNENVHLFIGLITPTPFFWGGGSKE